MATLTPAQIYAAARNAGFTSIEATTATAIALAESSGRTTATNKNSNGSTDYGLWQINTVNASALAMGDWTDPNVNARMAYSVYRSQGWSAWTVYKSGAYRAHSGEIAESVNKSSGGDTSDSWWRQLLFGNPIASAGAVAATAAGTAGAAATSTSVTSAAAGAVRLFETVNSPEWWKRIGIGAAGVVLILVALTVLIAGNRQVQDAAKTVAATAAKAAAAAPK